MNTCLTTPPRRSESVCSLVVQLLPLLCHLSRTCKVPLLPRKPPPPVPSSDDKPGGAGGKKKDKGAVEDIIPPAPLESTAGLELDQQLVVHTYNTALTSIQNMVTI